MIDAARSDAEATAPDRALAARVEQAGIDASAPREQRLVDGWLVRFSPGKAKRARSVQAVAPGMLTIDDKLDRCRPLFAAAGLPLLVRITPFSQPLGLDAHLAASGMDRIDDSRVMIATALPQQHEHGQPPSFDLPANLRIAAADSRAFAHWIGQARGSTWQECEAHAERIAQAPVRHQAFFVIDADGKCVAGAQLAIEDDLAGLYDVFTEKAHRRAGIARALCRYLLAEAAGAGASVGYLQVDAANETARSIYRSLGFVDAYPYHYRAPRLGEVR